jgi:methylenetetrahydrofolate dehydrogenase (NADP+)/methenyltetrahydrofolate cyclohydrolase
MAHLINGKVIAATLRKSLADQVASLPYRPCLAVILVGDDPASISYVSNKDKAARQTGIDARTIRLPNTTSQTALLAQINTLNNDPEVDGILVQFPLPAHIDPVAVVEMIDPTKDVDGFHPINVGLLASGRPRFVPCTPLGVMRLLSHCDITVTGARALVLGRSILVGRPLTGLLLAADATVAVAHSRTKHLIEECRRADILIAAIGQAETVRGDWIRPGATVIDVGINRLLDGRLVGDTAFDECSEVAGAITPVPGGVGPMTIACLLENTVTAAKWRRQGKEKARERA